MTHRVEGLRARPCLCSIRNSEKMPFLPHGEKLSRQTSKRRKRQQRRFWKVTFYLTLSGLGVGDAISYLLVEAPGQGEGRGKQHGDASHFISFRERERDTQAVSSAALRDRTKDHPAVLTVEIS